MHIVYILISKKYPNHYYIGTTQNINRRLGEHNAKKSGYARRYAPWRLETYITFNRRNLAFEFEKYLKSGSGNAFLKRRFI